MTELEKLLKKRELIRSQIDSLEKIDDELIHEISRLQAKEYLQAFNL